MADVVKDDLWMSSIIVVHNIGHLIFFKFNSRRCERQPLNLLKAVVHNDGHCHPVPPRTNLNIFFKITLNFGFFYFKRIIYVQNSEIYLQEDSCAGNVKEEY